MVEIKTRTHVHVLQFRKKIKRFQNDKVMVEYWVT
jgi:hypothetical protein